MSHFVIWYHGLEKPPAVEGAIKPHMCLTTQSLSSSPISASEGPCTLKVMLQGLQVFHVSEGIPIFVYMKAHK